MYNHTTAVPPCLPAMPVTLQVLSNPRPW